jgi:hypothetical protein
MAQSIPVDFFVAGVRQGHRSEQLPNSRQVTITVHLQMTRQQQQQQLAMITAAAVAGVTLIVKASRSVEERAGSKARRQQGQL